MSWLSRMFVVLGLLSVVGIACAGENAAQGQAAPRAKSSQPATRPVVAIVKDADPDKAVAKALELIGGLGGIVSDGQSVLIKPNMTGLRGGEFYPGQTTDVRVTGALVKNLLATAKCKIAIGDGAGGKASHIFSKCGYDKLAKDNGGIPLVDLAKDKLVATKVDGYAYKEYKYPATVKNADVFIDVPVLKTHQLSGISVGMKNLYGLLPLPRHIFHDRYDEVLCDLVQIRKPDLVLVDGLYAMEGQGPLWGPNIKMDLVIVGTDVVAVDTVCAAIMGADPNRVPYLALAKKKGLGECDLAKIEIRGEAIKDVRKDFTPARWFVRVELPKTPKLVAKIKKLCDAGHQRHNRDRGQGNDEYSFAPANLKVDLKKNPGRESYGFIVRVYDNRDMVEFEVRYLVLQQEHRQAAFDEINAWIKANCADVTTKQPTSLPLGGEWTSENTPKR